MSRPIVLTMLAAFSAALCVAVVTQRGPERSPLDEAAMIVRAHAQPGDLVVVYPHRWHFELDAFGEIPAVAVTELPLDIRRFNRVFVVSQPVLPEPEGAVVMTDRPDESTQAGSGTVLAASDGSGTDMLTDREATPAAVLIDSADGSGDTAQFDPTRFAPRSRFGMMPQLDLPTGSTLANAPLVNVEQDEGSGRVSPRSPLVGNGDIERQVTPAGPVRDEALDELLDGVREGRLPIFERDAGAFTVALWQSRDAATHIADLADILPTARVHLETHNDERIECPWSGRAFICPDREWVRVERVADNFAGQPLRCIWSHPPDDADLVIEFPRVHGASHVEGWYAHTDYAAEVYTGSRTVIDIEVDRGSRRFTAPRDRGRRPLQWRLPRRHDGPLTIRIHADRPEVAHFCWDLRLVHRVGVR